MDDETTEPAPDGAPADPTPKIGDTKPAPEAPVEKPGPSEYEIQLRHENAKFREQWGAYEKALKDAPDEVRAGALELMNLIGQGDDEAVRARIADVFGLELPQGVTDPAQAPLTQADFQQWQAEQARTAEQNAQVDALITEAKSYGVEHGTPQWYAMVGLLQDNMIRAAQDPSVEPLTVEAAVNQLLAGLDEHTQAEIDSYVAGKRGTKPAVAGAAPEGSSEIASFSDATRAALARVGARPT